MQPRIVTSQIEGGVAFGLTAALKGEITFTEGRVDQGNFDDFPLLRLDETPEVEVHLVPSGEPPTGIGGICGAAGGTRRGQCRVQATGRRVLNCPCASRGRVGLNERADGARWCVAPDNSFIATVKRKRC